MKTCVCASLCVCKCMRVHLRAHTHVSRVLCLCDLLQYIIHNLSSFTADLFVIFLPHTSISKARTALWHKSSVFHSLQINEEGLFCFLMLWCSSVAKCVSHRLAGKLRISVQKQVISWTSSPTITSILQFSQASHLALYWLEYCPATVCLLNVRHNKPWKCQHRLRACLCTCVSVLYAHWGVHSREVCIRVQVCVECCWQEWALKTIRCPLGHFYVSCHVSTLTLMMSQPFHLQVSGIQLTMLSMFQNVALALWGNFLFEMCHEECLIISGHFLKCSCFTTGRLSGNEDIDLILQRLNLIWLEFN